MTLYCLKVFNLNRPKKTYRSRPKFSLDVSQLAGFRSH